MPQERTGKDNCRRDIPTKGKKMDAKVSYKPQHVRADFDEPYEWLDTEIGGKWRVANSIPKYLGPYKLTKWLTCMRLNFAEENFRPSVSLSAWEGG